MSADVEHHRRFGWLFCSGLFGWISVAHLLRATAFLTLANDYAFLGSAITVLLRRTRYTAAVLKGHLVLSVLE